MRKITTKYGKEIMANDETPFITSAAHFFKLKLE